VFGEKAIARRPHGSDVILTKRRGRRDVQIGSARSDSAEPWQDQPSAALERGVGIFDQLEIAVLSTVEGHRPRQAAKFQQMTRH
jgi:hypothetical protein